MKIDCLCFVFIMECTAILLALIFLGGAQSRRSVELQHGSISRNEVTQLGVSTPNLEANNQFIDIVHSLASKMAQNTEVADNSVIWSPYSAVNVLPFINQLHDTQILRNGYRDSLKYIKSLDGLDIRRVSVGYVHQNPTANVTSSEFYGTEILPYPLNITQEIFTEILEQKFRNSTQFSSKAHQVSIPGKENKRFASSGSSSNSTEKDDEHERRIGEEAKENEKAINLPQGVLTEDADVFLTSMSVQADWETPFHPRYSRKSKFYLNETHAFKTKYLNNIGFYKIAELPDLNATAVAVPIKNTQRLYFVVVLPNSPEILADVSHTLNGQNISEIWSKFRTRRVQLSVPKITVNSQILFTQQSGNRTSKIIQIGSMKLGYNGIETRFAAPKNSRTEYKLTRLRRRKEDVIFRAHHPFIFFIYDSVKSGVLNYGEVVIPNYETNYKHLLKLPPPSLLSQNGKILQESLNHFGEEYYQHLRKKSHDANILVAPVNLANILGVLSKGADKTTESDILRKLNFPQMWESSLYEIRSLSEPGGNVSVTNDSTIYTTVPTNESFNQSSVSSFGIPIVNVLENTIINIHEHLRPFVELANNTVASYSYKIEGMISSKKMSKYKFYRNERDFINVSFIEYAGVAEYVSVPLWDAKILQLPIGAGKQAMLLLVPDEKSGLNIIEDGMREYPLERFLCQMQHIYVKVRIPMFDVHHASNISEDLTNFNITNFVGQEEFNGIGKGVRINGIIEDVQVKLTAAPPQEDSTDSRRRGESKARGGHFRKRKFQIDRPFLFFIRDIHVGTLAIGRVINPLTTNKPENIEMIEKTTETIETIDFTTPIP